MGSGSRGEKEKGVRETGCAASRSASAEEQTSLRAGEPANLHLFGPKPDRIGEQMNGLLDPNPELSPRHSESSIKEKAL